MNEIGFTLIGMALIALVYCILYHPLDMVRDNEVIVPFENMVEPDTVAPIITEIFRNNGKSVVIDMDINYGGYVMSYMALRRAARKSDKVVTAVCRKFCASAAAMTLYIGDYAKVYKGSRILFHSVSYGYRKPSIISFLETDMDKMAFRITLRLLDRIRSQVTMKEMIFMLDGNDLVLSGSTICERNDTIIDNDEYCMFKVNKGNRLYNEVIE